MHDEDGAPESVRRALRRLIEEEIQPGDEEAPEVAAEFFGRADALELIQEAIVEVRLARTTGASEANGLRILRLRGASIRSRERLAQPLQIATPDPRARKSWRKLAIAATALLAIGLTSSAVAIRSLRSGVASHYAVEHRTASTGVAELDTLELPDGSRVILAPNSSVNYAMAPHRGPRDIKLDGEAYFDVIHDERRPFQVETRNAVVTDLGTSFVVREYFADGRASVTVRSGAAVVQARHETAMPPIAMHSGDGAYVDSRGTISRFISDPESYGTWTNGNLAFDATPLPEVLQQLGNWYDARFELADSTLGTEYFTGEFRSVPLADALAILGPVVHARFEQKGRVVVVTARSAGH